MPEKLSLFSSTIFDDNYSPVAGRFISKCIQQKKQFFKSLFFFLLIVTRVDAWAQSYIEANDLSFDSSIHLIQKYIPYPLAFASHVIPESERFNLSFDLDTPWRQILRQVLDQADLEFKIIDKNAIILPKKKFSCSGYIYDEETGESLPGAHLILSYQSKGWIANDEGYFQLLLPEGKVAIEISYLGYQLKKLELEVTRNTTMDFYLQGSLDLPEVVVHDIFSNSASSMSMNGDVQIPTKALAGYPSLGYSMDVSRYLQLEPGVSTGGDGFGGMHVRGGGADQNLVLLDDIPIYNPFHMLGVTSIFNGDAIQQATFSKDYFAPKYSGRLSSVLSLRMRDGNRDSTVVNAGVSALDAHAMLEMPVAAGKGTIMLAGQRSHAGDLVRLYSKNQKAISDNQGFLLPKYRDYYAKALLDLSPRDKLILNFYMGSDDFTDVDDLRFDNADDTQDVHQYRDEYQWGNLAMGLRWLHAAGSNLFFRTNAYLSRYKYQSINGYLNTLQDQTASEILISELTEFRSLVREIGVDHEINLLAGRDHFIAAGVGYRNFNYVPGIVAYDGEEGELNPEIFEKELPLPNLPDSYFDDLQFSHWQLQGFASDHWTINSGWSLDYGFHTRLFMNDEGARYFSLEPRASLKHLIGKHDVSLSFSYVQQPQHLLSGSDSGLPNELWVPSSEAIKPQSVTLVDCSAKLEIRPRTYWEPSIYYRKMNNITSFVEEPNFLNFGRLSNVDASAWEEDLTVGNGESWGIENNFRLITSRLFLNGTYTFSKSWRQFDEKYLGYILPYGFERPHEFSLLGNFALGKRLQLSLSWQWGSGVALPLAAGEYDLFDRLDFFQETIFVPENDVELLIMPAYHRLDVSTSYAFSKGRCNHTFKISLLNVYNADNISFPTIAPFGESGSIRFVGGLPFIPSLAYHINFQ
jgi:hypothetical protein